LLPLLLGFTVCRLLPLLLQFLLGRQLVWIIILFLLLL
jgi:hypothetical protein